MSKICKIFGKNLKKWRTLRGLSQENIAELLNFHSNTIGRFERGEHFCKPETIEKLAIVLKIKPQDLFVTNSSKFSTSDTDIIYKIGKELETLSPKDLKKIHDIIQTLKS